MPGCHRHSLQSLGEISELDLFRRGMAVAFVPGSLVDFLEQVSGGTRSNEEAVQRLGESIRGLVQQAESLREDVAKFRV